MRKLVTSLLLLLCLACAPEQSEPATSQAEGSGESLVVYSGRNEALIGPLIDRFEQEREIAVEVRYGDTAEMAATLREEGLNTPADVFISQDAGALGALGAAGLLAPLSEETTSLVRASFRSPRNDWVGLSGRVRTVVYDSSMAASELPESLEGITDERFAGRWGVAPTNGSFQAHIAAYLAANGEEATRGLLADMVDSNPERYPNNRSIVQAVIDGEIDLGLVNHYYLLREKANDPSVSAENFYQQGDEVSGFVNLAGIGLTKNADARAEDLVRFLLSRSSQEYFAGETFEYPVIDGVASPEGVVDVSILRAGGLDFAAVGENLERALELIRESGLIR